MSPAKNITVYLFIHWVRPNIYASDNPSRWSNKNIVLPVGGWTSKEYWIYINKDLLTKNPPSFFHYDPIK